MTNETRIQNVMRLGYTESEARFLVPAALHSGYFVRRQFTKFCGHQRGGGDARVIARLTEAKHVTVQSFRHGRMVFHLCSKPFYAALGEADNRNRREHQASTIRVRLMALDFVLSHPGYQYFVTETEKTAYLRSSLQSPDAPLPSRRFASRDRSQSTQRFFVEKFPIFVNPSLAAPVASFCFVDAGLDGLQAFWTFLSQYTPLFRALPEFHVVYASPDATVFPRAEKKFGKFLWGSTPTDPRTQQILDHFRDRQLFEQRQTKGWDVTRLGRLRDELAQFSGSHFDYLFEQWRQRGDGILKGPASSLNGTVSTFHLEHDYDLLGTLCHAS